MRANRTFAIIKANPFLQNRGEPWHLRDGNWSLPTHILRPKEDKNSSLVQGHETFIPAPGAGHLADQQLGRSRNSDSPGWMSVDQTQRALCLGGFTGGRFRLQLFFRAVAVCFQREDSACQNQNPRTQWEGPFGIRQTTWVQSRLHFWLSESPWTPFQISAFLLLFSH